ncbi:MAG TPA: O-antigen ligase family protein [Trueperaceae bacterium]|nr:O-antigen ligase family protein [Trueperaceae bacterium]
MFLPVRGRWAFELGIAATAGAAIGLGTDVMSPWLTLVVVGAVAATYALVARPELSLVLMLVGYATVFDVGVVPYFGAGGVSLNVLDLALLGLLATIAVRRLLDYRFEVRLTPVGAAIGLFMLVAVASIAVGLLRGTTTFSLATTELRYLAYYMVYFAVMYLVRDSSSMRVLLVAALALSIATAFAMIVQFVVGPSVPILAGRIEQFAQDGALVAEVARILPPGRYLVLAGFIALTVALSLKQVTRRDTFTLVAWLTLGVAVLLTFNRNFWLSSGVALLVYAAVARSAERRRLLTLVTSAVLLGGTVTAGAAILFPDTRVADLAFSLSERIGSIVSPSTYTSTNDQNLAVSSLNFRKIETEYALRHLQPPGLLGLGVGAQYRPTLPALDWEQFDGRGYIHNGHLWILLKTGVLGYLTLVGAMVLTVARGLRVWRRAPSELRGAALGVPLVVLAVLLSSIVDPILAELAWAPLFGVLAGALDQIVGRTTTARSAHGDVGDRTAGAHARWGTAP